MPTTVNLALPGTAEAAREAGAQAARILRRAARPAEQKREPLPQVPYRHQVLFLEPIYDDGQPYRRDDEDDDTDT